MSRNQCQNSTAQIFPGDNSPERGSGGLALVVIKRNGEKYDGRNDLWPTFCLVFFINICLHVEICAARLCHG